MLGIVLGSTIPAAYACGWILMARLLYRRWRLLDEPVHCRKWTGCREGDHDSACYRQNRSSMVDSNGEAACYALLTGLIWPFAGLPLLVMMKPHRVEAEMAAKIDRLEKELNIH